MFEYNTKFIKKQIDLLIEEYWQRKILKKINLRLKTDLEIQ